jgi:hypothetical protein
VDQAAAQHAHDLPHQDAVEGAACVRIEFDFAQARRGESRRHR